MQKAMGLLKYLCPVQVTQIGEDFDISLSHACIELEKPFKPL